MEDKRKSTGGLILGAVMLLIAGFLIGGYGGSQLTATFLVNKSLSKDAKNVQSQVKALQHLRKGDTAQAIETMESRLDADLILFDPQEPYQGLHEQTQTSVKSAILQAKSYRQVYPRNSGRAYEDEMVRNLFDKNR